MVRSETDPSHSLYKAGTQQTVGSQSSIIAKPEFPMQGVSREVSGTSSYPSATFASQQSLRSSPFATSQGVVRRAPQRIYAPTTPATAPGNACTPGQPALPARYPNSSAMAPESMRSARNPNSSQHSGISTVPYPSRKLRNGAFSTGYQNGNGLGISSPGREPAQCNSSLGDLYRSLSPTQRIPPKAAARPDVIRKVIPPGDPGDFSAAELKINPKMASDQMARDQLGRKSQPLPFHEDGAFSQGYPFSKPINVERQRSRSPVAPELGTKSHMQGLQGHSKGISTGAPSASLVSPDWPPCESNRYRGSSESISLGTSSSLSRSISPPGAHPIQLDDGTFSPGCSNSISEDCAPSYPFPKVTDQLRPERLQSAGADASTKPSFAFKVVPPGISTLPSNRGRTLPPSNWMAQSRISASNGEDRDTQDGRDKVSFKSNSWDRESFSEAEASRLRESMLSAVTSSVRQNHEVKGPSYVGRGAADAWAKVNDTIQPRNTDTPWQSDANASSKDERGTVVVSQKADVPNRSSAVATSNQSAYRQKVARSNLDRYTRSPSSRNTRSNGNSQTEIAQNGHDIVSLDVPSRDGPEMSEVSLHIYEIGDLPEGASTLLEGVGLGGAWHVGVEVFGAEYCYGRWDDESQGATGVGISEKPKGHPCHRYCRTVSMGQTSLSKDSVKDVVETLAREWRSCEYHALKKNCISFAEELCRRLGVRSVPEDLGTLPRGISKLFGYFSDMR